MDWPKLWITVKQDMLAPFLALVSLLCMRLIPLKTMSRDRKG